MNFRDPKVFRADGKWYMVLATNYFGKGSILLFSSENMLQWEFIRPLIQEDDPEIPSMECPDFFPLGEKSWVLLASVMGIRTRVWAHWKYLLLKFPEERKSYHHCIF